MNRRKTAGRTPGLSTWAPPGRVTGRVTPKAETPDERAERGVLLAALNAKEAQYVVDGVFVEPENEDHHEARLSTL